MPRCPVHPDVELAPAGGGWRCVRCDALAQAVQASVADAALVRDGGGGAGQGRVVLMRLQRVAAHSLEVSSVAIGANGHLLASAGTDRQVQVAERAGPGHVTIPEAHVQGVLCVTVHPDGERVYSGGRDGRIVCWHGPTGRELGSVATGMAWVYSVAVHPDGQRLASVGTSDAVKLWDAATGAPVATLAGHRGQVRALAFDVDGARLFSAGTDGTVRVWSVASQRVTAVLEGHAGWVYCVAPHPDGRRVLSGGADGTVRVWDVASGQCLKVLARGDARGGIRALAVHPDGGLVAAGAYDEGLRVWDLDSGGSAGPWEAFGRVTACAVYPRARPASAGAGPFRAADVPRDPVLLLLGGENGEVSAVDWG